MPTTADQRIGLLLQGRYRLAAELGAGASAHVYLADDTRLRRPVALKILHPGLSGDPTFRRRLVSEAHSAATLNHPNIVHVYDWGDEPEGLYLVLEYLEGGSLRDLLERCGVISIGQAAAIGVAAANALAFAHERGLIHRDVKPANLMFDEFGSVHLADFGLAKALADASWTEPAGVVVGTARYASPEQALGQRVDGRSDVYALALVLYEAVTGRVPFVGETAYSTLIARIGSELPRAPQLGPLAPCLEAATHPDRSRRLDAAEFASTLRRVANVLPEEDNAPLPVVRDSRPLFRRTSEAADATTSINLPAGSEDPVQHVGEPVLLNGELDHTPRDLYAETATYRSQPMRRAPSGRKWGRWAIAAVVVAVIAGGAVLAVERFVVLDHLVPAVADRPLATAEKAVGRNGLRIRVVQRVFSSRIKAGEIVTQSPAAGTRERSGAVVAVVVSKGLAWASVPHVVGETKAQALVRVSQAHLVPVVTTVYSETTPIGRVVGATPFSGRAHFGTKVALSISLGPHPRTIPQFGAVGYTAAKAQLAALRLVPVERLAYSNSVQKGIVISTAPTEGATGIPVGSRVEVTVSRGPRLITVPVVANEPIAQAIANLRAAGLNVNEQIGPPFATKATTTNPQPGAEVAVGTAITLYVA